MPAVRGPAIVGDGEVSELELTRRDAAATLFTVLAVLVFAAAHRGWGVPLVGDSNRWAAAAIGLLGLGACTQGSIDDERASRALTGLLSALGVAALALVVLALVTGSETALRLLVADVVVLWAATTLRHRLEKPRSPAAA